MYISRDTNVKQIFSEIFEDQDESVLLARLYISLTPDEGVVTNEIIEIEDDITLQLVSEREFCVNHQGHEQHFHLDQYMCIDLNDVEVQPEEYSTSGEEHTREKAEIIGKKVTLPAGTFDAEDLHDLAARILELCDYEVDRG